MGIDEGLMLNAKNKNDIGGNLVGKATYGLSGNGLEEVWVLGDVASEGFRLEVIFDVGFAQQLRFIRSFGTNY
jgi:hypothetical protein